MATVFVHVRTDTGDVINLLCWYASLCAVGVLFKRVLYRSVLCLLLAGHLEIKLKKEQVASNECAYQGNMPLCGYPPISVSPFVPQPTRHFSFLLDSIKVARACSNNVYSVPSTKAEIIFVMVYCYSREPLIVILVHAPNSAMWP